MKKLAFPFILCLLSIRLQAQQVPNSGFESWFFHINYQAPASYESTAYNSYTWVNMGNVTRTTDAHTGNYAVRLETIYHNEPFQGVLYAGEFTNPSLPGGLPYSQRPSAVTIWVKGNITIFDSAFMIFVFKKNTQVIGTASGEVGGVINNYQQRTLPVSWNDLTTQPDTVLFAITSTYYSPIWGTGNVLYVDDIQFSGVSAQLPNNSFENWNDFGHEEPQDWVTSNNLTDKGGGVTVTKSPDHFAGNFSARVETLSDNWGNPNGFMGLQQTDYTPGVHGIPINQVPLNLSFRYKYTPVGNDSAIAAAYLMKYDATWGYSNSVSSEKRYLPPASNWTYYEIPFSYSGSVLPDTVDIGFTASQFMKKGPAIGSVLLVDAVELLMPVGISEIPDYNLDKYLSPNPSHGMVNLLMPVNFRKSGGTLLVYDALGNLVTNLEIPPKSSESLSVDLRSQPNGFYFFCLTHSATRLTGKLIKY